MTLRGGPKGTRYRDEKGLNYQPLCFIPAQ